MPKTKKPTNGAQAQEGAEKTPRERFLELAPKRTKQALAALRILGNCAGNSYEYSPEEAARILAKIDERVTELKAAFSKTKAKAKVDRDAFDLGTTTAAAELEL